MDTIRIRTRAGALLAGAILAAGLWAMPVQAADAPAPRAPAGKAEIRPAGNNPATILVPLFNHTMVFSIPSGWLQGSERSTERGYILEIVPNGQTVQSWTDMITLQAFRALGENPNATPAAFLTSAAGRIRQACGGEAITTALGAIKVDGLPAYAAILGCPELRGAQRGEVALHVAIMAGKDMLILQRAMRSPPFTMANSPITPQNARGALNEFGAIKLCERTADIGPCLARKPRE